MPIGHTCFQDPAYDSMTSKLPQWLVLSLHEYLKSLNKVVKLFKGVKIFNINPV
jgi:hypothetical protein